MAGGATEELWGAMAASPDRVISRFGRAATSAINDYRLSGWRRRILFQDC